MPNTSATFPRLHNWGTTDTVLSNDLNSEFNNILTNLNPSGMGSYSYNVTQMQIQTAPGAVGSESLATSLAGELERLRYQLATIQGTTYWYQTPASSLQTLYNALGANLFSNRVVSGVTSATGQPAFLIPDGSTNQLTLGTSTPFVYSVNGTSYTISSNVTLAGMTTAAASGASTTCVVSDQTITTGQSWTQLLGENGSAITIGTVGTSITALYGKIAAFKNTNSGELFIGRVASGSVLLDCYRGYFQTGASTFATRANVTNGDTLQLMQLAFIYANTAGGLVAAYTNPTYSGSQPSSPSVGDYWYDTSVNKWKTYIGSSWGVANATLVGCAVLDTTKCVGTRGFDFFQSFASTNTCELFASSQDSAFPMRSRNKGSSVSVYGTTVVDAQNYFGWTASGGGLIDSTTVTAGGIYYFYLSSAGNTYVSSIAPYDRQQDLYGYYHPQAPYRCLGYALATGSTTFTDTETFYRHDASAPVSTNMVTAAGSNLFVPYTPQTKQNLVLLSASTGAFTQTLPPPATWKGQRIGFIKTDTNISYGITIQAWGNILATGTATLTAGGTGVTAITPSVGLTANTPYLISGPNIQLGTTITVGVGLSTGTLSQVSINGGAGSTITIATAPNVTYVNNPQAGINGNMSVTLYWPNEMVVFESDGVAAWVVDHYIPGDLRYVGPCPITGTTSGSKGTISVDQFFASRDRNFLCGQINYRQTATGAQSGGLILTVPYGLSIDTSKVKADNGLLANYGDMCGYGRSSSATGTNGGLALSTRMQTWGVYDSTHLISIYQMTASAADGTIWAITSGTPDGLQTANFLLTSWFKIPIVGWNW